MHHYAMVRRPDERLETYLYLDRDHQQRCTRRITETEPLAHVITISSINRPRNVTIDLKALLS